MITTKISLMITLLTLIVTPLLFTPLQSFAADTASANHSNLTDFSYPNHHCNTKPAKPSKPARLATFEDVDVYNIAIAEYNVQVALYNKAIKIYKVCINQYIKAGNSDINIIRTKLNSALKEARTN